MASQYNEPERHIAPETHDMDDSMTEPTTMGDESEMDPMPEQEAPRNAFRESLSSDSIDETDDDFMRSISDENPHIGDQLDDPTLQREAEDETYQ